MSVRKAKAVWNGNLKEGEGYFKTGSGAIEAAFTFNTRFEEEQGTNPEELLGAALSGCYSMALSFALEQAGHKPRNVRTSADVHIEKVEGGFEITSIDLNSNAEVKDVEEEAFQKIAAEVKENCPVSKALGGGPKINLKASS